MVGKAALNRAWQNGEISSVPKLMSLTVSERPPKGRPLSVEEIRALLECAQSERLYRFIMLMLGTASRPDAIRGLTKELCDLDAGLIHLNPPGRKQTKKYRPTVRMPRQLRPTIERADDGYLITYRGQPLKSLKGGWRRLRDAAGLDADVQPYSLRHTIARHLRASGVPAWEVSAQLGHSATGMSITERYASSDATYLDKAHQAIERYLQQLNLGGRED